MVLFFRKLGYTHGQKNSDHVEVSYLTLDKGSPHSLWSGANDIEVEGDWVWENGESVNMEEAPWNNNQPNNEKEEDDCAIIYASGKYAMNDQSCGKRKPFLCQIS